MKTEVNDDETTVGGGYDQHRSHRGGRRGKAESARDEDKPTPLETFLFHKHETGNDSHPMADSKAMKIESIGGLGLLLRDYRTTKVKS